MDQAQVTQDGVDEAAELIEALQQKLADVVPTKLVAPTNRQPLAKSFVEFLEHLREFLEQYEPLLSIPGFAMRLSRPSSLGYHARLVEVCLRYRVGAGTWFSRRQNQGFCLSRWFSQPSHLAARRS